LSNTANTCATLQLLTVANIVLLGSNSSSIVCALTSQSCTKGLVVTSHTTQTSSTATRQLLTQSTLHTSNIALTSYASVESASTCRLLSATSLLGNIGCVCRSSIGIRGDLV
jgi:hypothetical protein